MEIIKPEFNIGQIVKHKLFNYRGVIFDVDHKFSGTEDWYLQVAKSRPPKNAPWYHVLPDNATHTTYVAERNLTTENNLTRINHPLVSYYFTSFDGKQYIMDRKPS